MITPDRLPCEPVQPANPIAGALIMARRGYRILRLKPGGKEPYAAGVSEATTDLNIIAGWADEKPTLNFGIAMGAGDLGLDADLYKAGGTQDLAGLGEMPRTTCIATPQSGRHFLLKSARDFAQTKPAPTIDVRSAGGYLVCVGSVVNGRRYLFIDDAPAAPVPPQVEARLGVKRVGISKDDWISGESGKWDSISPALWGRIRTEGADRSAHCYSVMCDLVKLGLTDDDILYVTAEDGAIFANKFTDRGDIEREIMSCREKWTAANPGPDFQEIVRAPAFRPRSLSSYTDKDMAWMWWPYIPGGALTVMGGKGGAGKGLVSAALVSALTRGDAYPCGKERAARPRRVLWGEQEDDISRVLKPRLRAAGANLDMVDVVKASEFPPLQQLRDYIRANDVGLIILSPVVSYLAGLEDMNSEVKVRGALQTLQDAIEDTDCGLLGIGHLNKKCDLAAVERLLGSVAFANFVRAVLLVQKEDQDTGQGRVVHAKFNNSYKGDDLLYAPPPRDEAKRTQDIAVTWTRAETNIDADSMFDRKKPQGKPTAGQWLIDYLQFHGPTHKEKVISDAEAVGFKSETIQKAHQREQRCDFRMEGFPARALWFVRPAGSVS